METLLVRTSPQRTSPLSLLHPKVWCSGLQTRCRPLPWVPWTFDIQDASPSSVWLAHWKIVDISQIRVLPSSPCPSHPPTKEMDSPCSPPHLEHTYEFGAFRLASRTPLAESICQRRKTHPIGGACTTGESAGSWPGYARTSAGRVVEVSRGLRLQIVQ